MEWRSRFKDGPSFFVLFTPFLHSFPPTSFESFIFWAEPAPAPAALGSIALHEGRHGRKATRHDGLKRGSKVSGSQTFLGTTVPVFVWQFGERGGCLRHLDWRSAVGYHSVSILAGHHKESTLRNAFLLYGRRHAGATFSKDLFTFLLCFVGLSYAKKAFPSAATTLDVALQIQSVA